MLDIQSGLIVGLKCRSLQYSVSSLSPSHTDCAYTTPTNGNLSDLNTAGLGIVSPQNASNMRGFRCNLVTTLVTLQSGYLDC